MKISSIGAAALLTLAGCAPHAVTNEQAEVANAENAYDTTVQDADTRADRLDDQAGTLDAAGKQVGGAEGRALRNEAQEDLDEAAAVRTQGQRQGEDSEYSIERKDGLVNQQ